jgi:ABC-type lipoprotein release transport system permease subunit
MALGATPNAVLMLIVSRGMALAVTGAAAGVLAAVIVSRLLRSLLFGIAATDALTFVGVPGLLVLIALIASYIPALRASRIDPAQSLRHE